MESYLKCTVKQLNPNKLISLIKMSLNIPLQVDKYLIFNSIHSKLKDSVLHRRDSIILNLKFVLVENNISD